MRELRDSRLGDLYGMARLANVLPHIHMFQRTCVPRELTDPREMDLNTAYACAAGTAKHIKRENCWPSRRRSTSRPKSTPRFENVFPIRLQSR